MRMFCETFASVYTGVGKRRFTGVLQINNAIINNNTRINSVSHTHNCKPTFAHSV